MRVGKTAALLWFAACGDSGSDDPKMCVPADGNYQVRYVEKSGDCDLGTFTAVVPIGTADTTQCTGVEDVSDDGCIEEVNVRCTEDGNVTKTVGTFHATKSDGTAFSGTAMVSVTLRSGVTCSSIFSTTGKKL